MPTEERIRSVIVELQEDYALQRVSIFGSYAEGRATADSDLDLMVEFRQPSVSLLTLNQLKYDLEEALGLPVDVVHAPLPENSLIRPGKVVQVL